MTSLLTIAAVAVSCSSSAPGRGAIVGQVLVTGIGPRASVAVVLAGPESLASITDASGRYGFFGLTPGDYSVTATVPSSSEVFQTVRVRVDAPFARASETVTAPDLVFTPIGTISGSVLLAGLDPQPSLTVTLAGAVSGTTATDASGAYVFGPLPPGDYVLSVDEPFSVEGAAATAVHLSMGAATAPDLRLTPLGALSGSVALAGLGPGAGVVVTLSGPVLVSATTDESGHYVFALLPVGDYSLSATVPWTAEVEQSAPVRVPLGPAAAPDLVFTPVGTLSGTVVLAGVDPQPALTVTISGPVSGATVTDASGRYTFGSLPPGDYLVAIAEPSAIEGTASASVHVVKGANAAPDLRLTAAGALAGTVLLSGLPPLPGIAVALVGPVVSSATTDGSGGYAFGAVPVGDYSLSVAIPWTAEGEQSAPVHISFGGVAEVDLVFTPISTISGTVTLAGLGPHAGLAVTLSGPVSLAASTDASGRYTFGPVPPSVYVVTATEPFSLEGSTSAIVETTAGATTVPALQLTPLAAIRGRVVLTGTPPQSGLPVQLSSSTGPAHYLTFTDATGAYAIGSCPAGDYFVSASAPSTAESTVYIPVHLSFGWSTAPDSVLTALGAIQGSASLADLGGAAGTAVWAEGTIRAGVTDASGAYALRNVPAGPHTVSALRAGYADATTGVDVAWASTTVAPALVLEPGAPGQLGSTSLSGHASVVGAGPRGGISVSVDGTSLSTITSNDGSWTITGVAGGLCALTLSDGVRSEHAPSVLALPGTDGFLLDDALYPIDVELQNAPRVVSGTGLSWKLTSDRHLVVQDGTDLFSVPLDGGPVVRLASGVRYLSFPQAPPPGARSWVAITSSDGTVTAVAADGGATVPIGAMAFTTFDPTGEVLFGLGNDGRLWYAALARGDVRPVARGWIQTGWPAGPAYAVFNDSSTGELGTVECATGNVSMLAAYGVTSISVAAGGSRIVVQAGGSISPLYGPVLVGPPAGPLTLLAPASSTLINSPPSFSPDGRWAVVSTFNLATAKPSFVIGSTWDGSLVVSEANASFLLFSPDSARFLYKRAGDLRLGESATGATLYLATNPANEPDSAYLFTPDSALLAFWTGQQLEVVETTAGTQLAALPPSAGYVEGVAFSPDEAFLVASGGSSVFSIALADGAVTVVSSTHVPLSQVKVTPDSQRVVFLSTDGLRSAPFSGAPVALLAPAGVHVGWSTILAPTDAVEFQSTDGFWYVPVDGGTLQGLGMPGPLGSSPSTSPDGLTIFHVSSDGVLRSATLPDGAPAAVATGVWAFKLAEGGLVISHTDSSLSVAPFLGADVAVGANVSGWSSGGGFVLFVDHSGGLFSAKIPTGETALLASGFDPMSYPLAGAIRGALAAFPAGGVVESVPLSGGPATTWIRGGYFWWLDDHHGLALQANALPPYRFQNGLYLVSLP